LFFFFFFVVGEQKIVFFLVLVVISPLITLKLSSGTAPRGERMNYAIRENNGRRSYEKEGGGGGGYIQMDTRVCSERKYKKPHFGTKGTIVGTRGTINPSERRKNQCG